MGLRGLSDSVCLAVVMKECCSQVGWGALREIEMLRETSHNNIVKLLDAFLCKERMYMVFELVDQTVLLSK